MDLSWLSKVGRLLATGAGALSTLTPLVVETPGNRFTTVQGSLEAAAGAVLTAEMVGHTLGNLAGPEKLRVAVPLVAQVLLASPLMAGQILRDPVLFQTGTSKVADGLADVLNSLKAPEA